MDTSANDGEAGSRRSDPRGDDRGQAALLLIESLMHSLVAKGVLSREDFIEVVDGAAEVEGELLAANAATPSGCGGSFLSPMANAFKMELGE